MRFFPATSLLQYPVIIPLSTLFSNIINLEVLPTTNPCHAIYQSSEDLSYTTPKACYVLTLERDTFPQPCK